MSKPESGQMWMYEDPDGGTEAVIVQDVVGDYAIVTTPGSNDEEETREIALEHLKYQQ